MSGDYLANNTSKLDFINDLQRSLMGWKAALAKAETDGFDGLIWTIKDWISDGERLLLKLRHEFELTGRAEE